MGGALSRRFDPRPNMRGWTSPALGGVMDLLCLSALGGFLEALTLHGWPGWCHAVFCWLERLWVLQHSCARTAWRAVCKDTLLLYTLEANPTPLSEKLACWDQKK